jgi:hypothetical protein
MAAAECFAQKWGSYRAAFQRVVSGDRKNWLSAFNRAPAAVNVVCRLSSVPLLAA